MDPLDEKVAVYIRIPRGIYEGLRQVISQEYGFTGRNLISATIAKAIKEYTERHSGDATHTF